MTKKGELKSGAIYTPHDLAHGMAKWSLLTKNDKILDLGVGEGAFIFASYERLINLGASALEASRQIFGAEIDAGRFGAFRQNAMTRNLTFPNVENIDFFDYQQPQEELFDVVIGNPPYVRRYSIPSVQKIRNVVLSSTGLNANELKNLSDLYIYFILHAATKLRSGGRLCVVTADPWLNVGYGRVLKNYLLQNFSIENLITIDRRLFPDVDVRAVVLHATKTVANTVVSPITTFTRVLNGLPIENIPIYSSNPNAKIVDVSEVKINQENLLAKNQWGIYFKIGELYKKLYGLSKMSAISQIASTQIGHQTLAKDFFILPSEKAHQVESHFLRPIAQAPKFYFHRPILFGNDKIESYVFCCNLSKQELRNTKALKYIEAGEEKEVEVRGKGFTVKGYQSKERIQRAKRQYWYDIQTSLDKRPSSEILVPRFIYNEYIVLWNQAQYVTGELFLEFRPASAFDTRVYLAILNSSLMELMFRVHAQTYGGGTNNMSPGEFKRIHMLNPNFISAEQREQLIDAYNTFSNGNSNREQIDRIVFQALDLDEPSIELIAITLKDLQNLSHTVKKITVRATYP